MKYKNLEVTPGLPALFNFELVDDTGVKLVLTNYTFKLDVFNANKDIIFSTSSPYQVSLGSVSFGFSATDTLIMKDLGGTYSLVVTSPSSFGVLSYKGFITPGARVFSYTETGPGTSVLPDGSIYTTSPTTIVYDSWYAIATYFRFLVSGTGVLVADGRDIRGTTFPNVSVFNGTSPTEVRWIPNFEGMTAFRVKKVSGSPITRYLP